MVEKISQATLFPIVAIELYDADHQMMVFAGSKGVRLPPGVELLEVPVNQTLSGTVASTGQLMVKLYTPGESKVCDSNETLSQLGIKTFICIPMSVNQKVLGVLSLAHPEPVPPSEHFLAWVNSLTGFIAQLIDRRQAEMTLRLQTEREQMIMAIAQRIRQSLHLEEILKTTVAEVRQFLHTDRVIILRFEPDWRATVVTESVAPGWASLLGHQILDTYFLETQGQAYRQGRIQAIADIHTAGFSSCYIDFLDSLNLKAKLVVPILQGEQLWGLLIAHHCSQTRLWQVWEIELLQQLTTQLEIAIQQSELYQRIQRFNEALEHQVEERTAELKQALQFEALLKRIADKVRDSLDEKQILQTAVQELGMGLGVQCCDAGLYSANQTVSTIAYEYTRILSSAQGMTFLVAESAVPEIYPYLFQGQTSQFCITRPYTLRLNPNLFAVLACPIVGDQGVIGDLWLFKHCEEVFTEQEVRLIQQVANHCAIALRQARLYQTAQAQVRELERLNHLKDDFLSTVSHELRTPMSSIKMATQMLEIMLERMGLLNATSGQLVQYFQILNSECKREINLINDLLDLARLDAESEPLLLREIDLFVWISHIAEPFLERTRQQQQQFRIDVAPDLPALITDLQSLERILTELLQNACKYTPAGCEITIAAEAIWKLENLQQQSQESSQPAMFVLHPACFQIIITNSGVEIPALERSRIFDKFYRIPNSDPWKHGGTGLGLALAKKLVERLQGTIEVQSYNHQTSFTIVLPQQSLDPLNLIQ
ncbi:hypothetical protein BST81_24670 [Leptolyngbya sp. 'hensonii']|nr:hypothetical protein BST81_24670 [Leptolyngbya sp. 'hensonii']